MPLTGGSGEVAKLAPDLRDRRLELTKRHGRALLETLNLVWNCDMRDELRRDAHPKDVRWQVVDHQGVGRREVRWQPVVVTQLGTDDRGQELGIAINLQCSWNAV